MNFKEALDHVFISEGIISDDPMDKGGLTKYGISWRFYKSVTPNANSEDLRNLTRKQAAELYKKHFWDKCRCDELPAILRLSVFDMAVNAGVKRATRMLQEAINTKVDGIIGRFTLKAASIEPEVSLIKYTELRLKFYSKLWNYRRFGRGWRRRVVRVIKDSFKNGE